MTGPWHYAEAERLMRHADGIVDGFPGDEYAQNIATAHVHATLALTAATMARTGLTPADRHEWLQAIDPEYAAEQAAEGNPASMAGVTASQLATALEGFWLDVTSPAGIPVHGQIADADAVADALHATLGRMAALREVTR